MTNYQVASDEYDRDYARLVLERNRGRRAVVDLFISKKRSDSKGLSIKESEAIRKYLETDKILTEIIRDHNKGLVGMLPSEIKPLSKSLDNLTKPNNRGFAD